MEFGELKPILATLLLPPAGPLLLAGLGLVTLGIVLGVRAGQAPPPPAKSATS